MGNENNSSINKSDRVNENDTKHAIHISESISDQLYDSIVRIENENTIGTGFFMKLNLNGKIKYFFFTCCHVLTQNDVANKKMIKLFYGKKREEKNFSIKLDNKERFIICFPEEDKDVTVIEILEKDNIPKSKYLVPDSSYKYGYDSYKKGRFILAGYPSDEIYQKERHISSGEIKDIFDFEFSHSLDARNGSSGSPICLFSNTQVIGIHKQGDKKKPLNYGTFIGIIIDELEQKYQKKNNNINNNINNINNNDDSNNNSSFISLKDFCSGQNLKFQKELIYYMNNQSRNNYLKALYVLKKYINSNNIDELKEKDLNKFFDILKMYKNVNRNYVKIIRNYTHEDGIWKYFTPILRGKNKQLRYFIIYFLAGFLKSLNIMENLQLNSNCTLYYGASLSDYDLSAFSKNIDEIICFKSFISPSLNKMVADGFSLHYGSRENKIPTIFQINYIYNENCLPDCFYINNLSFYQAEEEALFKPFSFFKINKVDSNKNEKKAVIILNYIGKSKDFESNLKLLDQGKNIRYNIDRNLLEII